MSTKTKPKKDIVRGNNSRYISLIAIIIVLSIIFGLLNNSFFGLSNVANIVRQTAIIAILSIGMTFVILTGGIDLSVGSALALSGVMAVSAFNATGSAFISFATAILCGIVIGLINGVLIGKLGISAFIATLAMQSTARGLTTLITKGAAMRIDNAAYRFISQENIFSIVPVVLVIVVILFAFFSFVCNKTVAGRNFYAVGGNANASKAMGISVINTRVMAYVLSGALAGLAAIVSVGRVSSAQPTAGVGTEFDVIIAVVIGGTSLMGGTGNMIGTVLGCVIMGIISNGLGLQSTQPYAEYIIKGILILGAVYIDAVMHSVQQKRLIPSVERVEEEHKEENKVCQLIQKDKDHFVHMKNITMTFPGMKALDSVELTIKPGIVMALMGENGAGKSTLMKILAGEQKPTDGAIFINDHYVDISSPAKAAECGIAMIHQEFSLVGELSVAQNIFLSNEMKSGIPGLISKIKMEQNAKKILLRIGRDIDPRKRVKDLSVSEQQVVEIAKVLSRNAWLLILDEPTSSLTEVEKKVLFDAMNTLRSDGVSMIYISHRMQEIFEIADEITVLRDGKFISTGLSSDYTENRLIKEMVGRELNDVFIREKAEVGNNVLSVKNLTKNGVFKDISFDVKAGEVVGFSGLMGAGRTEIAKCIFGLDKYDSGQIIIDGKNVLISSPKEAIKYGIAYVPEDRRLEGFVPEMSIKTNICMPSYPSIQKMNYINANAESDLSNKYVNELKIKTTTDEKYVAELSGGNQQKVSLGKWLAIGPKVLILDEPTRGIDVGAKAEIHKIIEKAAKSGMAIILISSELPEIIGCVDRAIVLRGGKITGIFNSNELDQDAIMAKAAFVSN